MVCSLLFLLFVCGSNPESFLTYFLCLSLSLSLLLTQQGVSLVLLELQDCVCLKFLVTRRDIVMEVAYSSKVGGTKLGVIGPPTPHFGMGLRMMQSVI
jgi:hypothetical protein